MNIFINFNENLDSSWSITKTKLSENECPSKFRYFLEQCIFWRENKLIGHFVLLGGLEIFEHVVSHLVLGRDHFHNEKKFILQDECPSKFRYFLEQCIFWRENKLVGHFVLFEGAKTYLSTRVVQRRLRSGSFSYLFGARIRHRYDFIVLKNYLQ
jgi:hypothetical protein